MTVRCTQFLMTVRFIKLGITFDIMKDNKTAAMLVYNKIGASMAIFIMLLICVESDKIPLLQKLKQLFKCLPVEFLINIAYTANNILYKLYSKIASLFLVYGVVIT